MRLLLLAAFVALYAVIKSNAAPNTTDVESSIEDATSSSSTDADIDAKRQAGLELVIDLARNFSIRYFDILTRRTPYVSETFSPLLDFLSLSLFSYATQGRSRTELTENLGFTGHDHEILELGFQTLIDRLNNYGQVDLCVRNEIHHSSNDSTTSKFADLTNEFFRLSIAYDGSLSHLMRMPWSLRCLDFIRWKLRHFFARTRESVITNSAKFNGEWKIGFDPSFSKSRIFWMNHWNSISVPTMRIRGVFRYGKLPEIDVPFIELPYKSKDGEDGASMFVIRSNDVYDYYLLSRELGKIDFKRLISENSMKPVNLYLPKFNVQSGLLGSSWIPEFLATNVSEINEILPKLMISSVSIDVSEHRSTFTTIPVTTNVRRMTRSSANNEVITFKVDRPFVAVIATTGSKIIELCTTLVSGSSFDWPNTANDV